MTTKEILEKLEALKHRFEELGQQLSDPSATADMKRFQQLSKQYKELEEVVEKYNRYSKVVNNYDQAYRSEEHTSELQSRENLVCRLLLEKKNWRHSARLSSSIGMSP